MKLLLLALAFGLGGCVSNSIANKRERQAYIDGYKHGKEYVNFVGIIGSSQTISPESSVINRSTDTSKINMLMYLKKPSKHDTPLYIKREDVYFKDGIEE